MVINMNDQCQGSAVPSICNGYQSEWVINVGIVQCHLVLMYSVDVINMNDQWQGGEVPSGVNGYQHEWSMSWRYSAI